MAKAPASVTSQSSVSSSKEWYNNHLSVGLVLGNASELKGANVKFAGANGSGDLSTSNGMAFSGEYRDVVNEKWNWTAGLNYFQKRDIDKFKGNLGGTPITVTGGSKPSFQPWVISGGAQYKINDKMYVPMGLNYTLINQTEKGGLNSFDLSPQFGYQAGIGGVLEKKIQLELMYQRVNYGLSAKVGDLKFDGDIRMEGFNLQGRYMF